MTRLRAVLILLVGAVLAASAVAARGQSPGSSGAATLREAVAMVERDTGGRILDAETVTTGSTRVYRIKVLTPDGTVRVVQVMSTDSNASS